MLDASTVGKTVNRDRKRATTPGPSSGAGTSMAASGIRRGEHVLVRDDLLFVRHLGYVRLAMETGIKALKVRFLTWLFGELAKAAALFVLLFALVVAVGHCAPTPSWEETSALTPGGSSSTGPGR